MGSAESVPATDQLRGNQNQANAIPDTSDKSQLTVENGDSPDVTEANVHEQEVGNEMNTVLCELVGTQRTLKRKMPENPSAGKIDDEINTTIDRNINKYRKVKSNEEIKHYQDESESSGDETVKVKASELIDGKLIPIT